MDASTGGGITRSFAERIVAQRASQLSPAVRHDAAIHVVDTAAAMVSAALLPSGSAILDFAGHWLGNAGAAQVVGAALAGPAIDVARVNGMLAHADETDDSHQASLTHPGCAVVPAALAVAQQVGATGAAFLDAVVIGYEVTARMNLALGPAIRVRTGSRPSSHALGGVFGATAASCSLLGADEEQTAEALSYAAQLASGVNTYYRDRRHVQKAFVFGGMPASNGVLAAQMIMAGLPGMPDPFDEEPNFLAVHSPDADVEWLTGGWQAPYAVSETNIKRYPVGSPAQAVVECAEAIATRVQDWRRVAAVRLRLPADAAHVVSHRKSPNLDSRYLAAVCLIEGRLGFARAHDLEAPGQEPFAGLISVTDVLPDDTLTGTRGGIVEVVLDDGTVLEEGTRAPLGTRGAPLPEEFALDKARFLFTETHGKAFAERVLDVVLDLERAGDLDALGALLSHAGGS